MRASATYMRSREAADAHTTFTTTQLLRLYTGILTELQARGAIRSRNNPIADYAEHLFCSAFNWTRSPKSAKDIDATDSAGVRYQIKCRRITPENPSRLLGALRGLPEMKFEFLGGVLFDADFGVRRAVLIPFAIVKQRSKYRAHTNSWRFHLSDRVWKEKGVRDVTAELRAAAEMPAKAIAVPRR